MRLQTLVIFRTVFFHTRKLAVGLTQFRLQSGFLLDNIRKFLTLLAGGHLSLCGVLGQAIEIGANGLQALFQNPRLGFQIVPLFFKINRRDLSCFKLASHRFQLTFKTFHFASLSANGFIRVSQFVFGSFQILLGI